MRLINGFLHAHYRYAKITVRDYLLAVIDLLITKIIRAKNITFHLPVEVQFHSHSRFRIDGVDFIKWVGAIGRLLKIPVCWENTAWLNKGDWGLKEQTSWREIPENINLCLDTGHLILGSRSIQEARERIREFLKRYAKRVKHLHIHENDLIHDEHLAPNKIIDKKLFNEIIKERTWIIEPPD